MQSASFGEIVASMGPCGADWIVAIHFKDGTVETRRVTPGRVTDEQAFRYALAASGRPLSMVRDATIRRAQDGPRSVVEQADEDIARIVAQARRER
jgi:hypothetical protein